MTAKWADGLEDAPWQVRAGLRFGLPTLLALVLLYFVLVKGAETSQRLVDNDHVIERNQAQIIQNQTSTLDLLRQHETSTLLLQRILLCLSLSKTDADRARCFQER